MARRPRASAPKTSAAPINSEAVSYFRNKGLQPSFDWQDTEPEEHAFAFTVAKATQVEVLSAIQEELDKAITGGETKESFAARLEPKLIALGWWGKKKEVDPLTGEVKAVQLGSPRRLQTIYWGNTATARAAGTWERAQRTKKALPFFVYLLGGSEIHREAHVAIANAPTILRIDDSYWHVHFPPNGWGCNCWVRQVSEAEAVKLGYDPERPPLDLGTQTYVNPRTGEVRTIPVGVDPGWETNPGLLRQRNLGRHIAGKLDAAPKALRDVAIKDVISSEQFRRIQAREVKGVAPVGVLSAAAQKRLGAASRVVLFSDDTADKQAGKRPPGHPGRASQGHPEVTAKDYLKVQSLIDRGHVTTEGNHMVLTGQIDGAMWKATIKTTRDGRENYIQTLHTLRPKQADVIKRRER